LTIESETYPLLMGMLDGSLLAHKMPWMDETWQFSKQESVSPPTIFGPLQFAIVYANIAGSHDLLCHAFVFLAQGDIEPEELLRWLAFLVGQGHLECPKKCISKLQGYVEHRGLIGIITRFIAGGVRSWPAAHPSDIRCECTEREKEMGIHEDIRQILFTGYDAKFAPFLELFAGVCSGLISPGRLNPDSFQALCKYRNLAEPHVIRARTLTGKSILDLEIERYGIIPTSTPSIPHRFFFDILNHRDILQRALEVQINIDELQSLVARALLRTVGQPVHRAVMNSLFDLIVEVGCPDVLDGCFPAAEMMLSETINQELPRPVTERLVQIFFASGVNVPHFQKSRAISLRRAMESRNWSAARALVKPRPALETSFDRDSARILLLALECPECEIDEPENLNLCRSHRERAAAVFHEIIQAGNADTDDEYVEALGQTLWGNGTDWRKMAGVEAS
jgi:hypothetical protein